MFFLLFSLSTLFNKHIFKCNRLFDAYSITSLLYCAVKNMLFNPLLFINYIFPLHLIEEKFPHLKLFIAQYVSTK
jgi:hypothetical protein